MSSSMMLNLNILALLGSLVQITKYKFPQIVAADRAVISEVNLSVQTTCKCIDRLSSYCS
jgi:hypothetical protein